ncbi:MAG: hypothetical protein ACFFCW_03580 [Candidatus Hodarchaeota archaeon]
MRGCRPLEVWEIKKAAKSFEGINAVRNKTLLILGHNTGFSISTAVELPFLGAEIAVGKFPYQKPSVAQPPEGRGLLQRPDRRSASGAYKGV